MYLAHQDWSVSLSFFSSPLMGEDTGKGDRRGCPLSLSLSHRGEREPEAERYDWCLFPIVITEHDPAQLAAHMSAPAQRLSAVLLQLP
jgi:hypothetical protein